MLDAVRFEELGVPAAAILTEPFRTTGLVMAELQGFADYAFATVPHPVASLSAEQVTAAGRDAVTPAVERLLLHDPLKAATAEPGAVAPVDGTGIATGIKTGIDAGKDADGAVPASRDPSVP